MAEAEAALDALMVRYSPEIAELGGALVARLRARIPHANALVFENYNALGVGFARGIGALNLRIIRNIVNSWIATVPVSACAAALLFTLARLIIF